MNILIIGGSNFIGWHLVEKLSKTKHKVTVVNRGNHNRIYPQNITFVKSDRADLSKVSLLSNVNFDVVYDMCAFNGEQIAPTIEIFKNKIKRYVFISSAAAYLDNQLLPITETAPCGYHPQWGAYGNAKYECEIKLRQAYEECGFPYTIIRPSYVYGVGNPIDRETLLFDRISKEKPIFIPYSGYGVIQLGYVSDLCDALCLLLDSDIGIGETYNVSGEEYVTLNGLVDCIEHIVGKKAITYHVNPVKYGFSQRNVFPFENNTYFTSINKFKEDFCWKPQISLKEGLLEAYLYWKENPIITHYENEEKLSQILKGNGEI